MINNLPPFYIGQKIVYITGVCMPKDSIHVVKNLFHNDCGCWSVDIGKRSNRVFGIRCADHNSVTLVDSCNAEIDWFESKSFRPIEEKFESISFEKVIEKEQELISVN